MSERPKDETMGNQQETDIAWLAGIFDGEGSITVTLNGATKHPNQNARKTAMTIANSDERIILRSVQILESIGIRPYVGCLEPASHQRLKRWRIAIAKRADIQRLTELLIPQLTAKKEQAILLNRYVSSRIDREEKNGARLTRQPISVDESSWGDHIVEFNDPLSGPSQTARKGAVSELHMIQSGLMREHERATEMIAPALQGE